MGFGYRLYPSYLLFKKRIAKQGKGKSGGFRTLLATNRGDKWFFIFGFQKNERSNIDKDEKEALKKLASQLLSYNNELLNKAITAKGLHEAGVMDKTTMREFDSLCLPPIAKLQPDEIKQVRESAKVSQAVFATILNISVYTVQKWESGDKKPTGAALKLLHMVKNKGLTIAY